VAVGELFVGNALSALDAKSRASLPADFRATIDRRARRSHEPGEEAPERLIRLVEHPNHPCLQGFDPLHEQIMMAQLEQRVSQMDDVDPINALDDEFLESFGTATSVGYDPSGRFVLPSPLRNRAGLELGGIALFFGAGQTFQIWNPDRFRIAFQDRRRAINALDGLLEQHGERRTRQ
jgi:MraZ protein